VTCLADLGILDQHGQAMAVSAAGHLGSAGERAFARQDVRTAANLLLRAADLLDEGDRTKARLLIDGGEALAEAGDLAQSALVLDHAIEMGRALGDHALETCARLAQLYFAHSTNLRSSPPTSPMRPSVPSPTSRRRPGMTCSTGPGASLWR